MFIFIDPAPNPFKCPPPRPWGGERLSAKFTEQKYVISTETHPWGKNCVLGQAELTLEG